MKLFESFSRRLKRELDVTPEAATLVLKDKLLHAVDLRIRPMEPPRFPVIQKTSLVVILRVQWFCLSTDPEEASQRLYDLDQMTRVLLSKKMGAFHLNSAGKGAFFYFGWPDAVADAAWLAWRAALRLSAWAQGSQDVSVKIGVHAGRLFSSLDDAIPDLLGEITEETATVCHNAEYNYPLVSNKVQQLLKHRMQWQKLQDRRRQSYGSVQALYYQANEENKVTADPETPLLGREPQLGKLTRFWQDTRSRMVAILADAGMGKTALVTRWLAQQQIQHKTIRLYCHPDLQHFPLETLFHFLTSNQPSTFRGGPPSPSQADRLSGYEQWMKTLDAGNIHHDRHKHRLFSRLASLFESPGQDHSPLYWLEDAHWCDTLTLEFLVHLSQHAESSPFLLVTGRRLPPPAGWPGHYLDLLPLPLSASQALLQQWLPGQTSAKHRKQLLHLSGNVPLVLRQLAEYQEFLRVPDALVALFSPGIDRLGEHRELALILAIAGTDTPPEEIAALMPQNPPRENIAEAISVLIELGLLYRVTKAHVRFTHPLIPRILEELNAPSQVRRIRQALMHAVD